MFVFTTFFKKEIDDIRYQKCIDSIKSVYPDLVIIRTPCEEAIHIDDYRAKSDVTRIKEMSLHEEALYFDSDVTLNKELLIEDKSKPAFHACWGDPDICVMYHNEQQQFFKELFKDFMKLAFWKPLTVQNLLRKKYFGRIHLYSGWKTRNEYTHNVLSSKPTKKSEEKNSILLFIPMATGQYISNDVYNSIAIQNVNINIVPCVSDGVYASNHGECTDKNKKTECMIISRNIAPAWLNCHEVDTKYVAMQDRDMVHLYHDNFQRCVDFLNANTDYVGVAMPWKNYEINSHIRMSAFVIRTDIMKNIKFRNNKRNHVCETFKEDLLKLGKWGFLPAEKNIISENCKYYYKPILQTN